MSLSSIETEHAGLGEYLRETRIKQDLELETVAEDTKISLKNLQSIEADDFSALPAEAFSKGFYALYAKTLSLDPVEILEMYAQQRGHIPEIDQLSALPPGTLGKQIGSMAERSPGMPFSFTGLILFILLTFGAFICWYFSWNPATFLSEKLRNLRDPQSEQVIESSVNTVAKGPLFEVTQVKKNPGTGSNSPTMPSQPGTVPAVLPSTHVSEDTAREVPGNSRYLVQANFIEETELTLTVDDLPQRSLSFKKGDSITWHASKKLIITLPAGTQTRLLLNNLPLDIPQTDDSTVTLKIPEILLQ